MRRARRLRRARGGFTLMEVVFAVAIVSVALLGLQAAVSASIKSAGDSINRRAAREECRTKLEEVLAGRQSPGGGGPIEDRPEFEWSSRSEERLVGMPEGATEKVLLVTVSVTFPVDESAVGKGGDEGGGGLAEGGKGTLSLSSLMSLPEEEGQ